MRGRRRRRKSSDASKRLQHPYYSAVCGVLSAVGALWIAVLWWTHASLTSLSSSSSSHGMIRSSHQHNDASAITNDKNPYFGWQPAISDETECSWRTCFRNDHNCRTCRDQAQDMGQTPSIDEAHWIPDVTLLHRMRLAGVDAQGKPWPPSLPAELCEKMGPSGGQRDSNKELLEQVPIIAQPPPLDDDPNQPKILCMVYTMEANHATTIRAMRETWASHCDGFLAFSTASDPRIPAISLPHQGKEAYGNMWQKVRSIWKFVGTHYLDDFDWFFQGGEDLFVLPQNLRNYLRTLDAEGDHFVGRRFKGYDGTYFNSGGSGYALSRGILRKYVTQGWDHPDCAPGTHTSMEDVMIARCLSTVFNVGLTDTRDAQGRERFHPFAPGEHLYWHPPGPDERADWYADYNREWPVKLGTDCCAPDSVSFHYIKKPAMVRHIYALLYQCGDVKR